MDGKPKRSVNRHASAVHLVCEVRTSRERQLLQLRLNISLSLPTASIIGRYQDGRRRCMQKHFEGTRLNYATVVRTARYIRTQLALGGVTHTRSIHAVRPLAGGRDRPAVGGDGSLSASVVSRLVGGTCGWDKETCGRLATARCATGSGTKKRAILKRGLLCGGEVGVGEGGHVVGCGVRLSLHSLQAVPPSARRTTHLRFGVCGRGLRRRHASKGNARLQYGQRLLPTRGLLPVGYRRYKALQTPWGRHTL